MKLAMYQIARGWISCCFTLLLSTSVSAQPFFSELSREDLGKESTVRKAQARGIAVGDYNRDGWPDLFLSVPSNPLVFPEITLEDTVIARQDSVDFFDYVLLQHRGRSGGFLHRTRDIKADIPAKPKGAGPVWGDYDNDGDLDLYVNIGSSGILSEEGSTAFDDPGLDQLLRNDGDQFVDVTQEAGLNDVLPSDNAIWLDYDRDGHLDLYVGHWVPRETLEFGNSLYHNKGDGTFADVTTSVGLEIELHPPGSNQNSRGSAEGAVAGDYDNDGWPDLYLSVFRDPNRLFLNDASGAFVDATTSDISDPGEAFGAAVGDIDNDGDLDIIQLAGGSLLDLKFRSLALLNLGGAEFLDVTENIGLGSLGNLNIFGPILVDFDNDGDLDLVTASPFRLFINDGQGSFEDRTELSGIDPLLGLSLVPFDYDLDGFVDLVTGWRWAEGETIPSWRIFRNNGNENHWLRIELFGQQSNRNGIGTRLQIYTGKQQQIREILGGNGIDQEEMVAHFGLDQRDRVDSLEIRWPSGQVDVLRDIGADQKIRVFEGRTEFHEVEPTHVQAASQLQASATGLFRVEVQPALFEAGAIISHVTANLSTLGGSPLASFSDAGDGTYSVEFNLDLPAAEDILGNFRDIVVTIEQETSHGLLSTSVVHSIEVIPDDLPLADLEIFTDELAANWNMRSDVSKIDLLSGEFSLIQGKTGRLQLMETAISHTGDVALEIEFNLDPLEIWSVIIEPAEPLDPTGYKALRFALFPGDPLVSSFTGPLEFPPLMFVGINGTVVPVVVDFDHKEWQEIEILLDDFDLIGAIDFLGIEANFSGRIYLDEVRLTSANKTISAVLEEHSDVQPQSFTLAQNYPNPFNSATVIRFALNKSATVELAVYSLVGQKVATLVQGERPTGNYSINWDGRDDQRRALASGVYLYRLRAGATQEQTRKLLLLR